MSIKFFVAALAVATAGYFIVNYISIAPANRTLPLDDSSLQYGYCCCTSSEVDKGTEDLLTCLNSISVHSYFRYFKVNTEKPCPYWAVELLCSSSENSCGICKCDENDIPQSLRVQNDMSDVRIPGGELNHDTGFPSNMDDWGGWLHADDGSQYVDLVANPEGNTGYSGPLAGRVWQAIHKENCPSAEDSCQAFSIFHTLLSGLQTSISMHVSTNFFKDPDLKSPLHLSGMYNSPNISFFPNCEMFRTRIAPERQFIENLYVLYQFTLRALTKAKHQFLDNIDSFNAGEAGIASEEDRTLHKNLRDLFESKLLCSKTFDETKYLESPRAQEAIPRIKALMVNVTHLMDCVTCEKCRLWGKLESKGIATAMKILMHPPGDSVLLDRAEKVTLINLARELSFSVRSVKKLNDICSNDKIQN